MHALCVSEKLTSIDATLFSCFRFHYFVRALLFLGNKIIDFREKNENFFLFLRCSLHIYVYENDGKMNEDGFSLF